MLLLFGDGGCDDVHDGYDGDGGELDEVDSLFLLQGPSSQA